MLGLKPVKASVRQLFTMVQTNVEREELGKEPLTVSLNRLLLGSPGTGKVSVLLIMVWIGSISIYNYYTITIQ